MKIALIFNKTRPDTTGIYYEKACKKQGHLVTHFNTTDFGNIPNQYDLYLKIDDDYWKYRMPSSLHPSVLTVHDTHLKNAYKHILKLIPQFDIIGAASHVGYSTLKNKFPRKKIFWLPFACDEDIHTPPHPLSTKYDIAFIGTDGGIPRKFILDLLRERYPNSYIGPAHHTKMATIYGQAKLGFNFQPILVMRIFESMAGGCLTLTNTNIPENISALFENKKHLVMYDSIQHSYDLIDYYLKHDEERKSIAQAGQQLVLEKHTYLNRLNTILEYV